LFNKCSAYLKIKALFQLSIYFCNEIRRGLCNKGEFELKPDDIENNKIYSVYYDPHPPYVRSTRKPEEIIKSMAANNELIQQADQPIVINQPRTSERSGGRSNFFFMFDLVPTSLNCFNTLLQDENVSIIDEFELDDLEEFEFGEPRQINNAIRRSHSTDRLSASQPVFRRSVSATRLSTEQDADQPRTLVLNSDVASASNENPLPVSNNICTLLIF
jgi:hypothetical protein